MELTEVDLNQLVLFQQLMVERRVSKVAENLGLTQPAVSNTLAKLRRQFGDDLFVRTPKGMMPTPFAEQLAEPIGQALGISPATVRNHFAQIFERLGARSRAHAVQLLQRADGPEPPSPG